MRVFAIFSLFFLHFNFWAAQHGAVATVDPIATDAAVAAMKQGGRKQVGSGYYIHVSPQQVYLAGGIWHPDMDTLASIRDFIVAWPNKFEKVVLDKSFLKTFDGLAGDQLKTAPRGFPTPGIFRESYQSCLRCCGWPAAQIRGSLAKHAWGQAHRWTRP